MKKKKTMLLIIIPAAVVLAIIGLLLWTITSRKSVNICTETSGSFIFSGSRYVYHVGPVSFIKIKLPENTLDDEMEDSLDRCKSAYATVCAADPLAYYSQYTDGDDLVFPYKDTIYYHRDGVKGKIYAYDTTTGQIREINTGHSANYAIGTDLTMEESVAILGMLDAYPSLDRLFADKGKIVWSCFYDYVGDRLFFEISDYVYEYLPEKDKLKKVFDAKKTNVRGVYSAFGN